MTMPSTQRTSLRTDVSTVLRLQQCVCVTNDLLRAVDDHGEAVLVLLDLSAAFDVMDHQILLKRHSARCGVTGKAHQWFSSFLENKNSLLLSMMKYQIQHALTREYLKALSSDLNYFLSTQLPLKTSLTSTGYQVFLMLTTHRSIKLSSHLKATAQYCKLRTVLRTYASGWPLTSSC